MQAPRLGYFSYLCTQLKKRKMSPLLLLGLVLLYFCILSAIGYWGQKHNDKLSFYLGSRNAKWQLVAFGMLGASLSGITFVSVPGMVLQSGYAYMQMVVGFSLGYIVVAHVLLPLYYKLQVTSIYQYLGTRLGSASQKTGSFFFLLSRTLGAALRLYAAALILHSLIFAPLGLSFYLTSCLWIGIIYLYTRGGGIKTIVWTDALQTLFIVLALCGLLWESSQQVTTFPFTNYPYIIEDWAAKNNWIKWIISGIFITISMTGLDQDMMQKNLSCPTLHKAQKNMYSYGFLFIPVNLAFLWLGACLLIIINQNGATVTQPDLLVLTALQQGSFSPWAILLFTLGIVAATCSSSDSALISLTTAIGFDFLPQITDETSERKRRLRIHRSVCACFIALLWLFYYLNNQNILDLLYSIASYTYGPLLGLFAFGLFTKWQVHDKFVPLVAFISPLCCWLIQLVFNHTIGYELLILNGMLTFVGLLLIRKK